MREHARAIKERTGIRAGIRAQPAQQCVQLLGARGGQRLGERLQRGLHRRIIADGAGAGERILLHPPQCLARHGPAQLHPRGSLRVGDLPQPLARVQRQSAGHHQHDDDFTPGQPPAQPRRRRVDAQPLQQSSDARQQRLHQRLLYPRRSTRVLITSVTTASSVSSEATAKAPTVLYSR